ADLVAHRREERALRLVGGLGLRPGLARLGEKLRIADRDADTGGHRREQALVGRGEAAFLARALHADHADRLAAHRDRYAEVRLGMHTDLRRADRLRGVVDGMVQQQRLAGLDDLASEAFAGCERREVVAVRVWKADRAGGLVE